MDEPRLTVSGAARRLGIAPATLRTWDRRYGIGPTGHARGRHRRYSADDMARLELMQRALMQGAAPAEAARYARTADLPLREPAALADAAPADPALTDTAATDTAVTETAATGTAVVDTALTRTAPADTAPADTGPADTGPADTGPADTVPADTAPADTAPADTGPADTVPADTVPADTVPADTVPADAGPTGGTAVAQPGASGRVVPAEVGVSRARGGGATLRMPGAGARARGLGRATLAMDSTAVQRLVEESIVADGIVVTWDEVAVPVLVAVGERWAATGRGVEVEHLLSQCLVAVFARVAASAYGSTVAQPVRPVLLAAMPGEQHVVPLAVLAALLAERGVGCRSLGAALPADALAAAVRRTAPAAVVLWSQLPSTADVDVVTGLPVTRPRHRTFVAGPGWAGAALPSGVEMLGSLPDAGERICGALLR